MTTNQPDSQAEDDFNADLAIEELVDNIVTHAYHHSPVPKEAYRKRIKAVMSRYAERLATERAINMLYRLYPSITVDGHFTVDGEKITDLIAELTATLTKGEPDA